MNHDHDIDALQRADVIDSTGDKVGGVGQVYLDDATGEPSFVTVKTGLFGSNESFVPVRGAQVSGEEIRVPYTKDVIKDAPNISEDGHLEPDQEAQIHEYYRSQGDASGLGDAALERDLHHDGDLDRGLNDDLRRERPVGDPGRPVDREPVADHDQLHSDGLDRERGLEREPGRLRRHPGWADEPGR